MGSKIGKVRRFSGGKRTVSAIVAYFRNTRRNGDQKNKEIRLAASDGISGTRFYKMDISPADSRVLIRHKEGKRDRFPVIRNESRFVVDFVFGKRSCFGRRKRLLRERLQLAAPGFGVAVHKRYFSRWCFLEGFPIKRRFTKRRLIIRCFIKRRSIKRSFCACIRCRGQGSRGRLNGPAWRITPPSYHKENNESQNKQRQQRKSY